MLYITSMENLNSKEQVVSTLTLLTFLFYRDFYSDSTLKDNTIYYTTIYMTNLVNFT